MEGERYYRAIFAHSNVGIASVNTDGRLVHWNDTFQKMLGYSNDELRTLTTFDLNHPTESEQTADQFQRLIDGTLDSYQWQRRYRCKDGSIIWGNVSVSAIRDEHGTLTEVLGIVADITERKRADEDLRKSETRLADAQRIASLGNWEYDATQDTLWWSDETCRIMGFDPEGFVPDTAAVQAHLHPDDKEFMQSVIGPDIRPGAPLSYEFRIIRPDGTQRTLHTDRELLFDDAGRLLNASGTVLDVTERKQTEDDLRRSQFLLSEAERMAHLGTWDYDVLSDKLWWSDETFRILGYEPGSFTPSVEVLMTVTHPKDREYVAEQRTKYRTAPAPLSYDHRIVRPDGSVRHVHEQGELFFDDQGKLIRTTGTILDITDQKQIENELKSAHDEMEQRVVERTAQVRRQADIIDQINDALISLTRDGVVITWNAGAQRMFGYAPKNMIGEPVSRLFAGGVRSSLDREIGAALTQYGVLERDASLERQDGTTFTGQLVLTVTLDEAGQPNTVVGSVHDVTEQRRAEQALADSEERFSLAMQGSNDGLWDWDLKTGYVYRSPRYVEMLGYRDGEVPGTREAGSAQLHPNDRPRREEFIKTCLEGTATHYEGEWRVRHKDGHYVDVLSRAFTVRDEAGTPIRMIGTHSDISRRKRAESALRESEAQLGTLTNLAPVALVRTDADGRVVYINDTFCKIVGRDRQEILGDGWVTSVHPEDITWLEQEWRHVGLTDSTYACEYRIVQPGEKVVWVFGQTAPVLDQDGHLLGHIGTLTDITDRKLAEGTAANAALLAEDAKEQAESASRAKSDFLSSMSHELRTPMNAILGYSQLLDQNAAGPMNEGQKDFVDEILRAGHHMLALIGDVLDLARIESSDVSLNMALQDPQPLISSCLKMVRASAEQNDISVRSEFPGGSPPAINVDALRFKQALLNLLSNAVKYNQVGGEVLLKCEAGANGILYISVTDTGPGIPADMRDKVFEPFDRLGAESSTIAGTGIGLTVTKQLIGSMGGTVGFESTLGEGTTFWIGLPVATEEIDAKA